MNKLLKAGFFRLKKDFIFWLFVFFTIGIVLFTLIRHYLSKSVVDVSSDIIINEFVMYIGLFIAIFVSIFVGKEHSEGIIRNKIIVGHSRVFIYLSNLIISIIASVICELIYIILATVISIPLFGGFELNLFQFGMSMLNTLLVIVAYCSIFNFVTMICSEITVSTTICIFLFIVMFIAQASFALTANSNKYIEHTYYENGNKYIISQEINPNYPGEQIVKMAKMVYLLIPQGQAMEIGSGDTEYAYQMPMYSLIVIGIFNVCGLYLFSKKELK